MIKVHEEMSIKRPKKIITLVIAIANKLLNELDFKKKINSQVEWDRSHWRISPGGLLKALVLSTFTDIRIPLTHLQERMRDYDLEYLIGYEAAVSDLNSFNVGRALERLGESDCAGLYENIALSALTQYDIPVTRTHSDTTTISFYGEYDTEEMDLTEDEQKELLQIEKGYNKDGRPGSNQAVIGQIATEHGIPLSNRALGGSTSDVEWNKQSLDYLEQLRGKGFKQGIYVADSKLCTQAHIRRMNQKESYVPFVTRCPANFAEKLASRMIGRAYTNEAWEELGQIGSGKKASRYRGISLINDVYGSPMRILVLESSDMAAKAELTLEKERGKLQPIIKGLESKEFVCRADAEKEYRRFCGLKELKLFKCRMEIVEEVKEKWPRGRRSGQTRPAIIQNYKIHIKQIERNEETCKQYMRRASCFVILSNIIDESTSNQDLLKTYKGQTVVENSFRQLKGPNLASVIYLKNPKRIQGLIMILSLSLLLRAIIQYRMRSGLK